MPERVYLDNAATSWPKPEAVYRAVETCMRDVGAAAGRGSYRDAITAGEIVEDARRAIAALLGARQPKQIVFTANGTDSLNTAIHGVLGHRPGHVITTVVEHNSVLRPLRMLERSGQIEVTRVGCDSTGVVDPDDIRRAVHSHTKLVVLTHASNVTGALQPAAEVARIAREAGVLFLLDAAQTVGDLPLEVEQLGVDLLAAPGHKGLLGPLGTGILYLREGVERHVDSLRQGGTGSHSEDDSQPETMPDKYESGNLNVPGLAGLAAGAKWLMSKGLNAVRQHVLAASERLRSGLAEIDGVRVHGPTAAEARVGIVSITLEGLDPQELAATLDSAYRVQVRSGLHCAPLMHRALGTLDKGGTVRFSLGALSALTDAHTAVMAVSEIAAALKTGTF